MFFGLGFEGPDDLADKSGRLKSGDESANLQASVPLDTKVPIASPEHDFVSFASTYLLGAHLCGLAARRVAATTTDQPVVPPPPSEN